MREGIQVPQSYAFAESYAGREDLERMASRCVNIVYDSVTGDVICLDSGFVLGERVPSPYYEDNLNRIAPRPVRRVRRGEIAGKWVTTHGNIPPSVARKIIKMYEEGYPVKEIAREARTTVGAVYEVLLGNVVLRSKERMVRRRREFLRRVSKEELKEILDEIRRGLPYAEIARRHGRSVSHIFYIAKKHGLWRPKLSRRKGKVKE